LCAKVRVKDVAFFAIFCLSRSVTGRFRRDCIIRTIGNPGPVVAPEAVKQLEARSRSSLGKPDVSKLETGN
jgi:hypothetical protein